MSSVIIQSVQKHIRIDKTIQDNSWMDDVEKAINSGYYIAPGPFANDTAAAANGVPLNALYRQPGGVVVWRQV